MLINIVTEPSADPPLMSDLASAADGVVAVSATEGTDMKSWSANPKAPVPAMEAWGRETDGMVNTDDTGASGDCVEVADSMTSCNHTVEHNQQWGEC